jgi:hypothetical protein
MLAAVSKSIRKWACALYSFQLGSICKSILVTSPHQQILPLDKVPNQTPPAFFIKVGYSFNRLPVTYFVTDASVDLDRAQILMP